VESWCFQRFRAGSLPTHSALLRFFTIEGGESKMTYPQKIETSFSNKTNKPFEPEMDESMSTLKEKLEKRKEELKIVSDKLKYLEEELVKSRTDMKSMNQELLETNHAVSVLAKNIDGKKVELEEKVHTTITTKVMPIIKDLQTDERIKKCWPEINSLVEYLNSITTKNNLYQQTINVLTETEMKIAAMVKNSMTSKQIAGLMYISVETVKAHRKNIRRKLKICNTKHKLSSYLMSVLEED
jgi:DNA-binding CsgD family transcriptional regulator